MQNVVVKRNEIATCGNALPSKEMEVRSSKTELKKNTFIVQFVRNLKFSSVFIIFLCGVGFVFVGSVSI